MTKRYWIIVLASVIMIVAATMIVYSKKDSNTGSTNMLPVVLRPLQLKDGWGYELLVDNKIYIHQDCIPAIERNKRFVTEEEAMRIGNIALDKIKKGHKPILTVQDINNAHIHY